MHQKLQIDKSLPFDETEVNLLSDFCHECSSDLNLRCDFNIRIVEDKKRHNIKTTAYYDPQTHLVCVLGKGRHYLDVCRSIAHELVHMMQHEMGLINGPIKDIGGFHEDQANALAGQIVKRFIYKHKL
jgi:hypothetical protein